MEKLMRIFKLTAMLASAVVLVTLATERKAIAQAVRAALVRNQDEPGRNPYSEQGGCFGSGCVAKLSPVPAGQRLVLTNLNIGMETSNGCPVYVGGHGAEAWVYPTTQVGAFQFADLHVNVYYEAGEQPTLTDACTGTLISATASGYYISLP